METETIEIQETEMIPVPHFDGYKCLGVQYPNYDHYVLAGNSLVLVGHTNHPITVTYEKLTPKRYIFEETGEYGPVEPGDFYINDLYEIRVWKSSLASECAYKILRKVEEK
jgi:hypothetical protein